ncbi:MAG: hypothetical protein KUG61_09910 [Parvibaculaceae bacterium]|nr:hypothetical protein [Parvibaculaceae bacterium]
MSLHQARPSASKDEKISPSARVARLIEVTQSLSTLIDEETAALKDRKIRDAAKLHTDKIKLSNAYAADLSVIKQNPLLVDRVPAEEVKRLKSTIGSLSTRLEENRRLLAAARSVSEGLIRSVAKISGAKSAPVTGYGRNAAMTQSRPIGSNAIALDSKV